MNTRKSCREIKRRGLMIMLAILLALMTTMPGLAQTGPNTMNFQGRLLDSGGEPRGGETHCMRFRMCKEPTCMLFGSVVWPSKVYYEYHLVTTESGPYKAGLFTVTLGDSAPITPELLYNHDTLYLEINVSDSSDKCTEASYTTLTPRSKIQTSAYAQRSRRVHTTESDDDYLVNVENTGAGGGVYAEADSTSGVGVYGIAPLTGTVGIASAASGKTYGVYGETNSTSNSAAAGAFLAAGDSGRTYGVYAENSSTSDFAKAGYFWANGHGGATRGVYVRNDSTGDDAMAGAFRAEGESGRTYGVWAQNDSPDGIGIYGAAPLTGVVGIASATTGQAHGVYAETNSTSNDASAGYFLANGISGETYGVWAQNDSPDGIGVYGTAPLTGVVGIASATTGQAHGVYAETNSTSYDTSAGYFLANGISGETYGVYAENNSMSDYAVAGYFHAKGESGATFGLYVKNDSTDENATAAQFQTNGGTAGYFYADGDNGDTYGVYAKNNSTGYEASAGYFWADGDSGNTRGVHVQNDSTNSYARAGSFVAEGGVGIYVESDSNNIIEAYSSPGDREFYVANDGEVHADGSFTGGGADFAEMLPGADDLEPGDVLVIGPDSSLIRSTEMHQTSVVGVYSTDPAFVGGSDEEMENPGKVPLAIVGVAPCKASAENGPIRPGDLLTTSGAPGHAMRAGEDPPQGSVLGKALEGLESGVGVIRILVTLQ